MKALGENIRKLRQSRGLTQQQLADLIGASNYTTVTKWESGANSPRGAELVKLSELFNVSVDELLGLNNNFTLKNDYKYFPTYISAGLPLDIDGITEAEVISIPDTIMGKYAGDKDIFITRINGDSMNKTMPDGSLIAVRPVSLENLKNGDIVVYSNEYEYSVKYFYHDEEHKRYVFRPHSDDRVFADDIYSYDNAENLQIHGKVVLYIVELD